MKTIFVIGSPCAGKTVLAARLYAYLLMKGKRVVHVPETVSLLIRQGKVTDPEDIPQRQILDELHEKIGNYEETGLTDYIISEDNPLATRLYSPEVHSEEEWERAFKKYKGYYVKVEFDIYPDMYDKSTRLHSYEDSVKLDERIDILQTKYKLPCIRVSRNTSMEDILLEMKTSSL